MKKEKTIISKIFSLIFYIVVICLCVKMFNTYKTLYFNGFTKGEYTPGISEFTRDKDIKYSNERSYKIYSKDFNDAMFYKEVEVKPNTVYKVSCMVKTENVEVDKDKSGAGALISLAEEEEVSEPIRETTDWQELTMTFNSKAREKVKIGFRLGGNDAYAKGTVWFSNLKLEEGTTSKDTNWKMACFILKHLNVNIENEEYNFSMSNHDIQNVKSNVKRFENSCKGLSAGKMTAQCDIYEIDEPISSLTYTEKHKYYIDPQDVREQIGKTVLEKEYDYVFVVARMGNETKEIPVKDWIGLGGIKLYDVGYSLIRMPNRNNDYVYTYDTSINIFPEEVFIHEFLHTLETNLQDYNYTIPELHDYEKYGYKEKDLTGLSEWYRDYMQCKIKNNQGEYVGLNEIVYSLKPAHNSDFKYSIEIEFNKEPQNILEEAKSVMNAIIEVIKNI